MSISKILGFLILSVLLISSVVAESPAPAPVHGGGRRVIAHSPSKSPTPESSVMPKAGSPSSTVNPSSISSPAPAPGPAQSSAVSTVFGGSVAVILCAAVLAM